MSAMLVASVPMYDRSDCSAAWKASRSVIHSSSGPCGDTSILLNASSSGSFVLYRIEHA